MRDPADIRRDIERTREELAASIVSLRHQVTEATDWRTWARRRPLAFLGGVFLFGLVLGAR
jgi:hypothetical protein